MVRPVERRQHFLVVTVVADIANDPNNFVLLISHPRRTRPAHPLAHGVLSPASYLSGTPFPHRRCSSGQSPRLPRSALAQCWASHPAPPNNTRFRRASAPPTLPL